MSERFYKVRNNFEETLPFMVGFDRTFKMIKDMEGFATPGYPPYNIVRDDENTYTIEVAVAGFTKDQIKVEVKDQTLTISGDQEDDTRTNEYLHRGIARRRFKQNLKLADNVHVTGADLEHGMLTVSLERIVPEAEKPQVIEIGASREKELLLEGEEQEKP